MLMKGKTIRYQKMIYRFSVVIVSIMMRGKYVDVMLSESDNYFMATSSRSEVNETILIIFGKHFREM